MENLSISDVAPPPHMAHMTQHQGPPTPLGQPSLPQQFPAQMFTTAAQLLDLTDKKLMVALRDGRKLIGILRSWDQFANIVLQGTSERIFVPPGSAADANPASPDRGLYADVERGIYLVRGENVLLLGEIDLDQEDDAPTGYDPAPANVVQRLAKKVREDEKAREKAKAKKLAKLGFETENVGEILL